MEEKKSKKRINYKNIALIDIKKTFNLKYKRKLQLIKKK